MSCNSHIVLKTEKLSIGYRTKREETIVAENINIELQKGELVGLIGINGIGKSTLLRSLTGVQSQLKGSIFINGQELSNYKDVDLAKALSLVLTEHLASKNLSVYELVALGRQPYTNWVGNLSENDIVATNAAISQVNIEDLKFKKCSELSDGQLQKVMIARALAQETNLIILDEPTTHLDIYHKAYILKLLKQLVKETNKTILFSSHEIDLSIQLCDKLIVMTSNGVITDSPNNLIKQGVFNSLFPEDLIAFDANSKHFKIN